MFKYGRVALAAIALGGFVPLAQAQAQGNFFIGGQYGQADLYEGQNSNTRALNLGYRWQASPIVQVGIEGGIGNVDDISDEFTWTNTYGYETERYNLETRYGYIGANARFQFGAQSRWFAIARLGYMGYDQQVDYEYLSHDVDFGDYRYSDSSDESGGGVYVGAGLGVDVTPNFNLQLMLSGYAFSSIYYDQYDDEYYIDDDVNTASTATLGVEFRF